MTDRTERAPSAFRLNLEQQKNRAKELLRAVKAGDAEALSRFAATRDPPLAEHTTVLLPQQLAGPCRQILTITDFGRAVLNGERDWHAQRPFPRWVGGVHIQPGVAGWRWDEARRDAVFRES